MEFTVDFFKDEVRHGFYIPTAIKQAWAAELSVLSEIDKVCRKHDIKYFADWGTLLGTVRHGGFIPWDDDLDICMMRKDYQKFLAIAKAELPEEFDIYNFKTKEDHWLFLSRVVNKNRICFEEEHLAKYHNFPYIASVDVFVLDNLYKDENKEQARRDKIMRLLAIAEHVIEGKGDDNFKKANIIRINNEYALKLPVSMSDREFAVQIYELVENIMAEVPDDEADRVCQIFPFGLKGHKGFPKEYYEYLVSLPFENISIGAPSCYGRALRSRYGDYFEVKKVWSGHDYPFFEGQKKALEAVGATLPSFKYDREKSIKKRDEESSLRGMAWKLIEETDRLLHAEITADTLAAAQQNLLKLGNMLEESYGENASPACDIVPFIEAFFDR